VSKISSEKLHYLKELIAQKEGRIFRERIPSSSLSCGVPQGAIVEISGHAKVEWLISFFKENPSLKIFWMESHFTLFPPALHQRGICLDHFVFAEVGDDLFPNIRKALRCQVFECIVSPSEYSNEKLLKALQLLTERANAIVFLLADRLQSSWPITLQFEVNRCPFTQNFLVEIKKNKGKNQNF
jgi:hypothetical protein